MKDADDWNIILETVDALFCSLADGIARRAGMTDEAAHEEAWTLLLQAGERRRRRQSRHRTLL